MVSLAIPGRHGGDVVHGMVEAAERVGS
jgi:hypothetical protein